MGLPLQHPTTTGNLPIELLSEILIRLPAKPLARMRSVSKPWNHFLSQPSFIKSHLHRSIENNDETLLVLLDGNYDDVFSITTHLSRSPHLELELPDFIKFPDNPYPCNLSVTFFGSVNGLICYGFRTGCCDDYVIQIWNPSLSAVLTLPPFNGLDWFLVNDLTHHLHFRFGYDPKTDDYKLVKLMSHMLPPDPMDDYPVCTDIIQAKRQIFNEPYDVMEVEVYSMRNGSWKLLENWLPSHVRQITDQDVLCADGYDGRLHWMGCVNGNKPTIVTFDLGVEAFGEICYPNSAKLKGYWNDLGFYGGKLCVMSTTHESYVCEVWVMNEYGVAESWTKLFTFSDFGDDIDPYGFTASNKFLFSTKSDSDGWLRRYPFDQLNIYDPDADTVQSFGTVVRDHMWTRIVRYVESLVWVAPTK